MTRGMRSALTHVRPASTFLGMTDPRQRANGLATRIASLVACALLAACGDDAPRDAAPAQPEGHQRMVALLRDLHARRDEDNVFVGEVAVRTARSELQQQGANPKWQTRQELGYSLLRLGREREAIAEFESTLAAVEKGTLAGGMDAQLSLRFHLGVAWLRLGETENCCHSRTEDSCILPLQGGALHDKPEGSTRAIEHFTFVLQNTKEGDYWHLANRWLCNVAAMTLGKWPELVPEPWRLPASAFEQRGAFPKFANVGERLGLDVEGLSGGMAVEDFDGDQRLDVMMSDWSTNGPLRLFTRKDDGAFVERGEASGLSGITGGLNLVTADYDNDGDVDVLVLRGAWLLDKGRYPNSLLQNRGDGTFTDVTFDAGLGKEMWPTQAGAFADYDLDGDLDLYVGNESSSKIACASQLFRNEGNGTFVDVAKQAGVENFGYAKGVSWGDVDGDRDPDLYVSNLTGDNRLYTNRGDGTFVDEAKARGVAGPEASFPCWFWDYDNDGALDLWVSCYATGVGHLAAHALSMPRTWDLNRLYRNDGKGAFVDVAEKAGMTHPAMPMGSNFGDVDGDGFLDCYLGTGDPHVYSLMPNVLYQNVRGERFVDVTMQSGTGHLQKGHGVAFADFDHDGDLDLFARIGGAFLGDAFVSTVFENPGFGNRHVTLQCVGTNENRSAMGARVRVVVQEGLVERSIWRTVGTGGSFGCNPLRMTIGLGRADRIVRVEAHWPRSGVVESFSGLEVGSAYRLVEGKGAPERFVLPTFAKR